MLTKFFHNTIAGLRQKLKPLDFEDHTIIIISILLFLYTFLNAVNADLTYDEAYTFMHYSNKFSPDFLAIHMANNHPLNSFLVYLTSFLFPYNELAIRFPNLLFLCIYLVCAIGISKKFDRFKLLSFGVLCLYFFLLPNFFAQARGYGIATALVLYVLVRFFNEVSSERQIISNFYILSLASSAFTGLLPFVFILAIYYLVFHIRFNFIQFLKRNFLDLIVIGIVQLYLLYNLLHVSQENKPIYGSESPFLTSTIGYYFNSFFSFPVHFNEFILLGIFIIFIGIVLFWSINKKTLFRITTITTLTFLLYFISSTISERPFITGRLLLPLYPLIAVSFLELFNAFTLSISLKKVKIFSTLIFVSLSINYVVESKLKLISRGHYQKAIFSDFNFDVEHKGCCSSIPFYLEKFQYFPPVETILSNSKIVHQEIDKGYTLYYDEEHAILLIEAGSKAKTAYNYHLKLVPTPQQYNSFYGNDLGKQFMTFDWGVSSKYHAVFLPSSKIDHIYFGQYGGQGRIWEREMNLLELP